MRYFIITGTSRGLGEAIAARLIAKDASVFCIARHRNRNLDALARKRGAGLEQYEFDLGEPGKTGALMKRTFGRIDAGVAESIALINNAGMIEPVRPAERCTESEIERNIAVNLVAPMALSSAFIRHTADAPGKKMIINISSGAGKHPYRGWSAYCSAKAAIDMFTRCVGLEQGGKNPVRIVSFAPGIVDTDMQRKIRETDESDFADRKRFVEYKEGGMLSAPDAVARRVVELLSGTPEQGGIYDIRDFD